MSQNPSDALPLTPLQQGMLSHRLQHPQTGADVEQMVCTLRETVDSARLRAAWERALNRHDALRLRYEWPGGEPSQFISKEIPLRWRECSMETGKVAQFLHADRFANFDPGE